MKLSLDVFVLVSHPSKTGWLFLLYRILGVTWKNMKTEVKI
ncbi:unnamed protein product, partial [Brassica rapa subsp. narinosa]